MESKYHIHVGGLEFRPYLSATEIRTRVEEISMHLQEEVSKSNKPCIFVGILNGSYRFLTDLTNSMSPEVEIDFLDIHSYYGLERTEVRMTNSIREELTGKHLFIVEDIIDTGHTMNFLMKQPFIRKAADLSLVTLLHKPGAFEFDYPIQHIGFEIPNDFVVGYGLDYNGLGRTLDALYIKV